MYARDAANQSALNVKMLAAPQVTNGSSNGHMTVEWPSEDRIDDCCWQVALFIIKCLLLPTSTCLLISTSLPPLVWWEDARFFVGFQLFILFWHTSLQGWSEITCQHSFISPAHYKEKSNDQINDNWQYLLPHATTLFVVMTRTLSARSWWRGMLKG